MKYFNQNKRRFLSPAHLRFTLPVWDWRRLTKWRSTPFFARPHTSLMSLYAQTEWSGWRAENFDLFLIKWSLKQTRLIWDNRICNCHFLPKNGKISGRTECWQKICQDENLSNDVRESCLSWASHSRDLASTWVCDKGVCSDPAWLDRDSDAGSFAACKRISWKMPAVLSFKLLFFSSFFFAVGTQANCISEESISNGITLTAVEQADVHGFYPYYAYSTFTFA